MATTQPKKVKAVGKDLYIDGQLTGSASNEQDALKIAQNTASQSGYQLDMSPGTQSAGAFPAPGGQFFPSTPATAQPANPIAPTLTQQPGVTANPSTQTDAFLVNTPNYNYATLAKQFGLPDYQTPDTSNQMKALEAQRAAQESRIASESIRAAKDVETSGQQRTGAAKSALARIGALGTTTASIGALDTIKSDTDRLTQEVIKQKEQALRLADQGFYEQAAALNAKAEDTARKNYQQNFDNLMNIINFTTQLQKNKQQDQLLPLQLQEQQLRNQGLEQQLNAGPSVETLLVDDGQNQKLVNKTTGEQIAILGPSKGEITQKETVIEDVGGKKVLLDRTTGETIKELGPSDTAYKGSAAISGTKSGGNYGITAQGYEQLSPELQAVYNNPGLLNSYTPTKKGQILGALANAGLNVDKFAAEKLSSAQRTEIDQLDTVLREAENAMGIIEQGLDVGPIASRIGKSAALVGQASPEFTDYRSSLDNLQSILLKARSGAAVTPQEYERIKGFIPNVNDDEKTVKTKLKRFAEETTKARENYIKRATQTALQIVEESQGSSSKKQDSLGLGL